VRSPCVRCIALSGLFSPLHQLKRLLSQVELAMWLVEAAIRFSRPWSMEFLAFSSSLHGRMDAEFCLNFASAYYFSIQHHWWLLNCVSVFLSVQTDAAKVYIVCISHFITTHYTN
jgi:hypothetical protein